jgi:glutaminyl-tRNA synthetase
VKGTIHWVSASHAIDCEVRLYDHLFKTPEPARFPEGQDWTVNLNANSLEVIAHAKLEPSVKEAKSGQHYQFERHAYFVVDRDSTAEKLVFNRAVSLKDSWSKEQQKKA